MTQHSTIYHCKLYISSYMDFEIFMLHKLYTTYMIICSQ